MVSTIGVLVLWAVAAPGAVGEISADDWRSPVRQAAYQEEQPLAELPATDAPPAPLPPADRPALVGARGDSEPAPKPQLPKKRAPLPEGRGIPGLPPPSGEPIPTPKADEGTPTPQTTNPLRPAPRAPVPEEPGSTPTICPPRALTPAGPNCHAPRYRDYEDNVGQSQIADDVRVRSREPRGSIWADQDDDSSGEVILRDKQSGGLRDWLGGITTDGWIDQGFTLNTLSPRNRSNGTVGFNDRSNEYQLNQLYLRVRRDVDAEGDAWDVGGRVDLLYGTDWIYTAARGLEVHDDLSSKWNAQRYGLAMPQLYMEAFCPWASGITIKLGHFYAPLGYETVPAPENFFYSHSYAHLYGEPFTFTGLVGETTIDQFTLLAGLTRGFDNWEDNNDALGFVGGARWASRNQRTSIAMVVSSSREQPDPSTSVRTVYSLVLQQKLGDRWQYVFQHDLGAEPGAGIRGANARWYGIDQYLFYTINDCWKAGLRVEWFRDENGSRVPGALETGEYYELCPGVNWTPSERLIIRSEVRWDWTGTPGLHPFGDHTRSNQLLWDCDVIWRF